MTNKYFTIAELCRTNTALNNTPPPGVKIKLATLIERVLNPLREQYGKPIIVNSGYRSHSVNKAVGGGSTSQHLKGEASDITTGSKQGNKVLFELLKNMDIDQCINEKNYSWIHVSYRSEGNRNQYFNL